MTVLGRLLHWLAGILNPASAQRETPGAVWADAPPAPQPARPSPTSTAPNAADDPYFKPEPLKLKGKGKLNLSATKYLPVTRAEIKAAAKNNLFANVWFGRRDLIPPASDPRTSLIDRGLVTQGFLSPEQLDEIHAVGDAMDAARDSIVWAERQAAQVGEAAVQADRAARAELKARKKAEAAARRAQRADDIAWRKATDITFLGRGVSGRLGDRTSQVALLETSGLPVLSTPADLAKALDLTIPRLRGLAFHTEVASRTHYVQFRVPKRSGGERTVSAPHRTLANAQRWIFEQVVSRLPTEAPAHGFVAGRSILSNATPHAGRAVVVNMDLEGFFPSIGFPRVRKVFERAGYSPAAATILALLCTECPRKTVVYDGTSYHVATAPRGLPQGACTSPGLSNAVARRLDRRLAGLAAKLGWTYSRYADDLTFSADAPLNPQVGYLLARVRHIARDEGFVVNESKTRVQRRNSAQTVTGLIVNDRPGAPRDEVRRLRAILHRARTEGLAAQNREARPDFLAYLHGKIAFVSMARPDVGGRLRAELDALVRSGAS